jgi:hypothetical protein
MIKMSAQFWKKLARDNSGLAVVEFAVGLPFFMGLTVAGVETANYATVMMQLNQITIHTADSAARMGEATMLSTRQVREVHINDVFAGSMREGASLELNGSHAYVPPSGPGVIRGNARFFLSSVEEVSPFVSATPRYRMRWQRCSGAGTHFTATYGTPANKTSEVGIGPTGRQITAPPGGAVMFVETKYAFRPMVIGNLTRMVSHTIHLTASMVVRENRDYTQVYNPEAVAVAAC